MLPIRMAGKKPKEKIDREYDLDQSCWGKKYT